MEFEIRELGPDDADAVLAAARLFDDPPRPEPTQRFLAEPQSHLLFAFAPDGRAAGFVSGIELVHPDKQPEMFLAELGVDAGYRKQGLGRRLTEELAGLARARGCAGMWVGTEVENVAARRTYERAGGTAEGAFVLYSWELGEPDPGSAPAG